MSDCEKIIKPELANLGALCTGAITCYDGNPFTCVSLPQNPTLNDILIALQNAVCSIPPPPTIPTVTLQIAYNNGTSPNKGRINMAASNPLLFRTTIDQEYTYIHDAVTASRRITHPVINQNSSDGTSIDPVIGGTIREETIVFTDRTSRKLWAKNIGSGTLNALRGIEEYIVHAGLLNNVEVFTGIFPSNLPLLGIDTNIHWSMDIEYSMLLIELTPYTVVATRSGILHVIIKEGTFKVSFEDEVTAFNTSLVAGTGAGVEFIFLQSGSTYFLAYKSENTSGTDLKRDVCFKVKKWT